VSSVYILGIDTFLAVVRSQSFKSAADTLYIAQSTVSQRIKALENEIGMTLIERSKGIKQIRLTPYGEEFYKLAEQWSHIWREAMILKEQGPKLSLVIGSVDSVNTFLLPQVYRKLSRHHPPIKLTIRTAHSEDLYEEVEKRKVDVAFVLREQPHPSVQVTKCFTTPMVVLRPGKTAFQDTSTKIRPSELDPNYELMIPWRGHFKAWHEQWWNPLDHSQITLDSIHIILSLLQDPKQWTVVPKWIADSAINIGNYSVYTLTEQPPDCTCYKLTHIQPMKQVVNNLDILDTYFQQMVSDLIT
jgi:DNA-binding transcriptional LysR family regulator